MRNSQDYAVRFGETVDRGAEPDSVFPFMYTMVPFANDTWERDKSPAGVPGFAGNMVDVGPAVGPNATVMHGVNLEPDYPFKLLFIKYTVYQYRPDLIFPDKWIWWDDRNIGAWGLEIGDYQAQVGTQLTRHVRSTVSFLGSDGRILYGGMNMDAQVNLGASRLPMVMSSSQGYDYGPGHSKTPYLLPREATIMFELTNTNQFFTFYVGAVIYGMKVRL